MLPAGIELPHCTAQLVCAAGVLPADGTRCCATAYPIEMVGPCHVGNAALFAASDVARDVTGPEFTVDAREQIR